MTSHSPYKWWFTIIIKKRFFNLWLIKDNYCRQNYCRLGIEYVLYKRIVIIVYAQIELRVIATLLRRVRMFTIMSIIMTTFVATSTLIISKVYRMCNLLVRSTTMMMRNEACTHKQDHRHEYYQI